MELYRQDLLARPEAYGAMVRANAVPALNTYGEMPAQSALSTYLTGYMAWGSAQVHMAFGVGQALDEMAAGQWHLAEATMATLMAGLELLLVDQSRWSMGWLLTHLPDPPWHLFSTCPQYDPTRPYGCPAPTPWIVAAGQYVKDAASLEELGRKQH